MRFVDAKRALEFHKTKRSNVEAIWDVIQRYVLPFRALFFKDGLADENAVNWRRREIYDDTAVDSAQTLAATINSNLTNPVLRWFEIVVKDKALNNVQRVKLWLETVSERIFQVFQSTNFNLAANETYHDLVGFGTATMAEEIKENTDGSLGKVIFNAIPIDQCYFDEDEEGRPINFYREILWTPLQMVNKFGLDGTPKDIIECLDDPIKSQKKFRVLYVVYRRHSIPLDGPRPVGPLQRPFGAKYFLLTKAKATEENTLGEEQGYYSMPVFIPRWRKVSGSQWGYSPSMVILSTILSLNKLVEIILRANEKVVDPPLKSTKRGVLGNYDLRAGQVTIVKSMDAVQQWEYKGRLDFGFLQKDDMKQQVREAYFVDQLQLKESPAMTATEVNVRYQLMQKLVGPTVGQIQYDFLGPLIQRTFHILLFYRLLPPPPEELLRSGVGLDIEYLGPMAKAQRQDVMVSIERWMMGILQAAQQFPEAADVPDIDQLIVELGYSAGVPAKIIKSKAAIMAARLKRAQEMEQMKQAALAEQNANTAATLQTAEGGNSGRVRTA